jgi:hypothetical protein
MHRAGYAISRNLRHRRDVKEKGDGRLSGSGRFVEKLLSQIGSATIKGRGLWAHCADETAAAAAAAGIATATATGTRLVRGVHRRRRRTAIVGDFAVSA